VAAAAANQAKRATIMMLTELPKRALRSTVLGRPSLSMEIASLRLKQGRHKVSQVLVQLTEDCALGSRGESLQLPIDTEILPVVLNEGAWEAHVVDAFLRHVPAVGRYTLVDIGANVGLFSRQVLRARTSIVSACCVEPSPDNFACLSQNLGSDPRAQLHPYALGETTQRRTLYRDAFNHGNYSLLSAGVPQEHREESAIELVKVGEFFASTPLASHDLLWKSDTQGYDQLIVSLMPDDIWSRVRVAVMELCPARKPNYELPAMAAKLRRFRRLEFVGLGATSVDEVLAFLQKPDAQQRDLLAVE
jgi:FkbM family methyltransferase